MKLLRISSVPDKQIKKINDEFDLQNDQDYEVALTHFFKNFINTSDAIVHALNETGKCTAEEVIYNHKKLQDLWLKQYDNNGAKNLNEFEVLKKQIQHFDPDVIFVNYGKVPVEELKSFVKKGVYLIAWDGFVKPVVNVYGKYDLVLTCLDSIANAYHKIGTKSEIFNFGFDKRVLDSVSLEKTESLNFVGNLTFVHAERQIFLKKLVESGLDISLYIGNFDKGVNPFSRTILREVLQNKRIKFLSDVYQFQRKNKGVKYGIEMYKTIAQSASTLNFHGDEVEKACNMRLFEAPGLGTCLITDDKPGLDAFFKIDEEVVVFKNDADLIDKVKYLQENPEIAHKIGLAGQKRIFKEHLWSHRVNNLLEIINRNI
jgi:spore maturation protein CgeB